jgi:hypothetical protein
MLVEGRGCRVAARAAYLRGASVAGVLAGVYGKFLRRLYGNEFSGPITQVKR